MSENIPITFTWRRQLQEADWPERKRKSVMAVAFILEDYADPDGQNVYPANDTIAFKAGMNIKTVRDVLRLMNENRFLRRVGKARYGQSKYRLIYPALPVEPYLQRPTNSEKSKTPTNRTESPSAHSSPDGDIVAPSANTERSVSVPKVEVDRRMLERKGLEFLRPFFERGDRVSIPESRTLAQKYYDDDLNDLWQGLTRTSVFSDMIRFMESLGWDDSPYESIVSVLSGDCTDKTQIKSVIADVQDRAVYSLSNGLLTFQELYASWRNEFESGWFDADDGWNSERVSTELSLQLSDDYVSAIIDSVERLKRAMDDSRDRVMAVRANAGSVSVSATNTGSDASIVEKIVETVSEKVVERW